MAMKTPSPLTDEMRAALRAIHDGHVRMGVEENPIHPARVQRLALTECFAHGYADWTIYLPGGRAKLTPAGVEALR